MTLTSPVSPPSNPSFAKTEFRKVDKSAFTESRFSFVRQFHQYTGQRWAGVLTLPPLVRGDGSSDGNFELASEWTGWLSGLNGPEHYFDVGPQYASSPRGAVSNNNVQVKSIDSTSTELTLKNLTANTTDVFKRGDFIEVNNELKQIVDDASSGGSGEATLSIEPAFRTDPSNGDSVTYSSPKGRFRLASNQIGYTINKVVYEGIEIPIVEAVEEL